MHQVWGPSGVLAGFQHDHGERPQHQIRSHLPDLHQFPAGPKRSGQGLSGRPTPEPQTLQALEKVQDVALVGIVGKGLLRRKGSLRGVFTAVAERNVNVEMISSAPRRWLFTSWFATRICKRRWKPSTRRFSPKASVHRDCRLWVLCLSGTTQKENRRISNNE